MSSGLASGNSFASKYPCIVVSRRVSKTSWVVTDGEINACLLCFRSNTRMEVIGQIGLDCCHYRLFDHSNREELV